MKNLIRWGLAGATAMALLVPGRASAQWTWDTHTGGSNFTTSMGFSLEYTSGGLFTLNIQNLGTTGEIFTRVALVNVPAGLVFVEGSGNGWTFDKTNLNGDGVPGEVYLYWSGDPGNVSPIAGGISNDGQSYAFTFQADPWTNAGDYDLRRIGVGVHAQAGPETCSTKFAVWRDQDDGYATTQNGDGSGDPTCQSVPEPGTNALLAIGLFGMAFVAVRRKSLPELLGRA